GEALLNDATAIALFVVLLGMVGEGHEADIGLGAREFVTAFLGGAAVGVAVGRLFLAAIPWLRDDRLAESTLTVATAYLAFIVADRVFHVSGVVSTLAAALTISFFGRSRISPYNRAFLGDLWEQISFWARSLVFIMAAILIPKLVLDITPHDVLLIAVLVVAAYAARILVLFTMLPPLSWVRLTEPISTTYRLAIAWGGLRGALTLALALAVTEHPALGGPEKHFVAVLATGFLLFTLLVSGTTLRPVIRLLGLDRLAPRDRLLRDQVLALSYQEMCEAVREMGEQHNLAKSAVDEAVAPYEAWSEATSARGAAEPALSGRERVDIALVALGNQERALAFEMLAQRAIAASTVQTLLDNADALIEGARSDGRQGYMRAARHALSLRRGFRVAYFLYRRLRIAKLLAARLGARFEVLLSTRLLISELVAFNRRRLEPIFGERVGRLAGVILARRLAAATSAVDALRHQYPEYAAALETRFLRQSALRREMGRYRSLYEEGLIAREVYDDLRRTLDEARDAERLPRFDLGLDPRRLIERADLLAGLGDRHLGHLERLLRPRFTVPGEAIVRAGERGEAVYFIASGAVEVRLPEFKVQLGSGDFFGESALLNGEPQQADVIALTYCQMLVLRKADFERFLADNPDAGEKITQMSKTRRHMTEASRETTAAEP
ncbi:MAG: cation:proton antiporter, partial [Stellaceae bacterium]